MSDVPLPADLPELRLEETGDALWQWNVLDDVLVLSPQAASLLGREEPGLFRGSFRELCESLPVARREGTRQLLRSVSDLSSEAATEVLQTIAEDIVCCRCIVLERFPTGKPRSLVGMLTRMDGRRRLYAACGDGNWVYDLARQEFSLDRSCARLLQRSEDGPLRAPLQTVLDMLTPESARLLLDRFAQRFASDLSNNSFVERLLLDLPDGSRKRFLVCGALVGRGEYGRPAYMTGNLVCEDRDELPDSASGKNNEISLMALFDGGDGLWDWNIEKDTIYYSPRYITMLGYDEGSFGYTFASWRDKLHPDEKTSILKQQMDVIMSPRYGDSYEQSFRMRRADGSYCWILSRARVLRRNSHGRAMRLIGLHTDITTTQGERDRLAEMIEYDPLTDAHSLVYFYHELDRLSRLADMKVCIISCDVNGLKLVNDYLGHETGNDMLQSAVRLLRTSVRSSDCVARLGGDEFAVLLPQCDLHNATRILEKIRGVFMHYNEHSGNVPVIMSFGLSGTEEAASLREALALADRRMLHEKHSSRLDSGHAIKAWIEKSKDCVVSLEDTRYDG